MVQCERRKDGLSSLKDTNLIWSVASTIGEFKSVAKAWREAENCCCHDDRYNQLQAANIGLQPLYSIDQNIMELLLI